MFSLQNRCDGSIDHACMILSQFLSLQNSPLFSVTDESYGFSRFPFRTRFENVLWSSYVAWLPQDVSRYPIEKLYVSFVSSTNTPRSTIPPVESKQNSFSNLRGIVNALCALEDNGLKKYHPLSVPLTSTETIKFYRQDPHKSLPNFPRRCVIVLGWHPNKFFHCACHLLSSVITLSKRSTGF